MAIGDDGSLKDRFLLCSLHTATDMKTPGAVSMCVDENDRIYAATELGIQVIRSAGIINAIFEYPTDERVTDISFDMNDQRVLYLKTDKGVYKRELLVSGRSENSVSAPNTIGYY